eukprot:10198507-Alexandrium_andersonii.AAC.1
MVPDMLAPGLSLPVNENPNFPAGPPVYSWDYDQTCWKCLLCKKFVTKDHINSERHRSRYREYLEDPDYWDLPPALPAPAGHAGAYSAASDLIPL